MACGGESDMDVCRAGEHAPAGTTLLPKPVNKPSAFGSPPSLGWEKTKKKARQVSLPGLPPPDTSPSSGGGCGASERSADFERVRGAQVVAHDVRAAAAERLVFLVFLAADVAGLEAQRQVRVPHPAALLQHKVEHRSRLLQVVRLHHHDVARCRSEARRVGKEGCS